MATRFLFLLLLLFPLILCKNNEKCIQKSACTCEFEDGRIINLQELGIGKKSFTATSSEHNLTYYFHPCFDEKIDLPKGNYTVNECEKTSLCLVNSSVVNSTVVNSTAINLGSAADGLFTFGTNNEKFLVFTQKKHNITTIIHLGCLIDYPEPIFMFKNIDSNTAHNLVLASSYICPFYEKHGLSTGSVLVIMLLTLSSVYLMAGAAVLYFIRGARGREMIPNYEFWSGLPGLVRDGAIFLQNGCKPVISTADSYDRI